MSLQKSRNQFASRRKTPPTLDPGSYLDYTYIYTYTFIYVVSITWKRVRISQDSGVVL